MRSAFYSILLVFCCMDTHAQVDPHFSQYYAYQMWMNPGMTGVMDGGVRVTGVYRNQWGSVMVPYKTAGLSAEVSTEKNLNIGANLMDQSAGDGGYRYVTASLSIAYSGIRFGTDKNQQITAGIQIGMLSRRFDPSKFQYGDQWNPVTGYDPAAQTADVITKTSASAFDIGAGLSYSDNSTEKNVNLFGGVSAFHLNKPASPFLSATNNTSVLPVRLLVHGGGRITVNDRLAVTPNIVYMQQGSGREIMGGLFGQYNVSEGTDLYAGVNYRVNDAVSPMVGVGFNSFVLGASYDITMSDLTKAVPGTNAFELSLSWMKPKSGKPLRYLSCPKF